MHRHTVHALAWLLACMLSVAPCALSVTTTDPVLSPEKLSGPGPQRLAADAAQSASASSPAPASEPAASGPLPGMAVTLALAPGVVVHGAGHFYAGRPLTGAALIAAEAGALYLLYRGGTGVVSAIHDGVVDDKSPNFGKSEEFSRSLGLAAGGLAIFLASWFYDLSGAPIAAAETAAAKKTSTAQTGEVKPQVQTGGIGLVWERKF